MEVFVIKNALILNLSTISPTDEQEFLFSLKELYGFFKVNLELKNMPEPTAKDFVDALAKGLDTNDIVITIGGIGEHLNDIVKTSLSKGLNLETIVLDDVKDFLQKNYPVKSDKFGEQLYAFPDTAYLFPPRFSYTYGFGISSENQTIIALPNHTADCKEMLLGDVAAFCAEFAGGDIIVNHSEHKLSKAKTLKAAAKSLSGADGVVICSKIQDICKVVIAGEESAYNALFQSINKAIDTNNKNISKSNKSKSNANIKGYKALITIFIIIAISCIGYLLYNFFGDRGDKILANASSEITSSQSENGSEPEEFITDSPQILSKIQEPYNINGDTVGWLSIDGTNIDYPVVQYTDNQYYKNKSLNGEDNTNGTLFVDYRTDFDAPSGNIVIYGKNPKDNSMLADITGYKSVEFYKEHPIISFSTLYEESLYKVSGVMVVNGNPDQGAVYDFEKGIAPNSMSEIGELGGMIKDCTFIHTDLDITEDDQIITLYTDSYEFLGAKTVVVARKLRDGENPTVNTSVAKKNENPLMPDVWYKAYGGYKPGEEPPSSSQAVSSSEPKVPEAPSSQTSSQPQSSTPIAPPLPPTSTASNANSNSGIAITKLSVHPNSIVMSVGDIIDLDATITPDNATNTDLTWKSNNDDVIYIYQEDDYVEIEALEEGDATITVTAKNGVKTAVKITVEEAALKPSSKPNSSSHDTTPPSTDVMEESFTVKSGGKTVKGDAYTIVCQIVENETRGNFHQEALKAHVVATYSYLKYNKARGLTPSVILRSSVSANVKKAVSAVLGEAVYYNNQIINATYYSTGNGNTTTSKSVWGTDLPYLVSVESPYDDISPYYKGTYSISKSDFIDKIYYTYGIDLSDESNPSDWIEITSYNPGDYINRVSIGGYDKSLGGEVSKGSYITARNMREQLFDYSIRSTSFDVKYSGGKFIFTTYGYGHGVGMSQWGAQGMALEGYSYDEILTHYYSNTVVK